ncbi:MAG: SDR family oxidoreductase [Alphaproteobacteria bacterium]|nr:MAG: SDR family oxidoreductase [Alphaproteobacteria bacterium]
MLSARSSLFDMSGQVAVITGSTKGIGRAIAERMAQHGARVVISSRRQDACDTVADGIRGQGGEAIAVACNIGRKPELQALVERTLAEWGKIDTLVCNAAVNPYFGPGADIPDDAWDRIMGSNIRSNHWLSTMVLPGMAERGDGSVIIVSSIAGLRGNATIGAYGVSKAADMQLTRNLAVEWGPRGIRANCIAPGLVRTDFARALWEDSDNLRRRTADTPLQRIGEPDEIAGAAVFLAAASGRFMTGQTLVIDGGVMAGPPRQL